MTEITTKSLSVDFLGFLRSKLQDLQGIPTLCYELIQNADDVKDGNGGPGASKIVFDVCDDALYVFNDGVFREIDFERMQKLSWGDKREEEDTIGSFGLGFVSVYQITDSPELFSSGRHWQFMPNGPEEERILETRIETVETKFRLPWAFDESEIRKDLGIPPISKNSLDSFTTHIDDSIESAALFLKQVKVLELKRNGELIRRIETIHEDNKLLLSDGEKNIIWRIYEGNFNNDAEMIRKKYREIIERKRRAVVKIAIPDTPEVDGLLYAFLPSENLTGLPFHINADFYPSSDRKRIIFGESYKSEWNEKAITCATRILANNCDAILEIFENRNQDFWEFAQRVKDASTDYKLSFAFSKFWELLKPEIRTRETVLTASKNTVFTSEAVFLDSDEQKDTSEIYENLGLNTVHLNLRRYRNLLLETGVQNIRLDDVINTFSENNLMQRTEISSMPTGLKTLKGWRSLWKAIENLWHQSSTSDQTKVFEQLKKISITFGSDGALWPPNKLFITDQNTKNFFSKISQIVWYDQKEGEFFLFPKLVTNFFVEDGLNLLEKSQVDLHELWQAGFFSPKELLEWLELNRRDIKYTYLVQRIKNLSLWPTSEGQLSPLSNLYLAGDFEDPLSLASLVDLKVLGGSRDFLEQVLNVSKLDFITYVRDFVPLVIQQKELKLNEKLKLTQILGENLGKLRESYDICESLSKLPIIWCGEEQFYPAREVWFDTEEVKDVLGSDIHLAKLTDEKQEAVRELYEWLGVSPEPAPKDIVKRIKDVVQEPPTERSIKLIGRLIGYIASKWVSWEEDEIKQFSSLRNFEWLPGIKNHSKWFSPENVYSIYSRDLFDSVGNFLLIDRKVQYQQNTNDFFRFLEIESEPTPAQVVQHLLWSSNNDQPITNRIYNFLNFEKNVGSREIDRLVGEKCLYLKDSEGNGAYYLPDQVFWEQHPFGSYRFCLPHEFGQYKDLMDRIGVKTTPDVDDALKVLLEISKKFGTSNIALPENTSDEDILIFCWKMISEALENEEIKAKEISKKLKDQKTIPDSRTVLNKPSQMFFEDRPGWSEKFKVIEFNITPRIEGAWLGMEAAGVRPLSSVVTIEMVTVGDRNEDQFISHLLQERQNLIRRVIEEHRMQGNKSLSIKGLEHLICYKANPIDIVRIFTGFNKQEKSKLESVDAILHKESNEESNEESLFFTANNGTMPWRGIARELSYVINPTGDIRSLGMELKDILSQSLEEAILSLDELGYPKIEVKETTITEGPSLDIVDDIPPEIVGIRVPVPHPDGQQGGPTSGEGSRKGGGQESGAGSGDGSGSGAKPSAAPKQNKRKTSRLVSYVYPEDAFTDREEDPRFAKKRSRVANVGVEKVVLFERENGREPIDMEEIQVHHPGYDVESTSDDGSVRYIEVKSLSGMWDSQNPAQLTKMEFKVAKQKGKAFWLYVVERAEAENFKIHKIQDPGNRVDYYLYDHGWDPNTDE